MAHTQRKSLDMPDETRLLPNERTDIWNLGDFVVGRITFEPGWRWSKDIIDATATAERVGPAAWATMLAELNADCRRQIDKFRGKLAAMTGDGVIAMFDGAERAIRCAAEIAAAAARMGFRAACRRPHRGSGSHPRQHPRVAVHVVSRVTALASAGEVLISGTTHELVADSDLRFEDRGQHELKGVTGARQIWALVRE